MAAGRSGREFIAPLPVIDPQFAAYLVFTTLLVVTPGSATAVVVRNVLDGGRRQGMAAAVGAAIGNTTYAVLSALGLAALFARSPLAFLVLRIVGTCYLAFLGVRSLWLAWRPRPAALPGALESAGAHGAGQAVRIGMTQGAANNLVSLGYSAVEGTLSESLAASSVDWEYVVLDLAMMLVFAVIVHRLTDRWQLTVRRGIPALDVEPAGGPAVLSGPPAVGYPEPRSDSPTYGVQSEVPRED